MKHIFKLDQIFLSQKLNKIGFRKSKTMIIIIANILLVYPCPNYQKSKFYQ